MDELSKVASSRVIDAALNVIHAEYSGFVIDKNYGNGYASDINLREALEKVWLQGAVYGVTAAESRK